MYWQTNYKAGKGATCLQSQSLHKLKQKDHKFNTGLGHIVSSRPTLTAEDSLSQYIN